MVCRVRLTGAVIAVLAAVATLGLKLGLLCYGDSCLQEQLLLGRPASSWGLAVYGLSAFAFLFAPRFVLVPWAGAALLAHGALYIANPVPCPVCVGTLLGDCLLVVLAAGAGTAYRFSLTAATAAVVVAVSLVATSGPYPGKPAVWDADLSEAARTAEESEARPGERPGQQQPAEPEPTATPEPEACVRLVSPDGTAAFIDLRASPVVVFSPDCKHCGRVLEAVSAMAEKPVLAATRPEGAPEKPAGLSAEWYVLAEEPPQGIPALIYWDGRREVVLGASAVLDVLDKKQKGGV